MLGDDPVERLDVFEGAAHEHGVVHALAVVGEDPHAGGGVGHRAQLGQLTALQADGDGADRVHVAVGELAAEPPHLLHHAGGVGDGRGVGHGVHGGVAAAGGGLGAGLDGLGVLAAGLAQVGVQIHEAGQHDRALGVHGVACRSGRARPDLGDDTAVDPDVDGLPAEDPDVRYVHAFSPPSSRYRTAMRMVTPLATCSTIVDRAESATSAAISMPRFIGPGCMTIASSGILANRSRSRP